MIISNNGNGLISFRKELIQKLCELYVVFVSVPDKSSTDRLEALGATVLYTKMERRSVNPIKDIGTYIQYNSLLRKHNPDIVLTYTIKPNVYGGMACQRRKKKYIANVTGLGTSIENKGLLAKVSLFMYKKGLKGANCVFFQNSANRNLFIEKGITKGNTRLIPGSGVNLSTHPFEDYPTEDGTTRLLFIGRIMKDKGIYELIQAVNLLNAKGYRIVLDVVGRFDEKKDGLLIEAQKMNDIVFHGYQPDVNPFIKKAHCVVLPSYHEGMSNVLLEAASSGRPVIATDVPGCRETFDEGITGFGCKAKDVESLASAIEHFISLSYEEKAEMGRQGRKKVEREFDRGLIVNAYLEEIQKLL